MKQKASQTCDSYMSELKLALPECKYRNDADELLKDQFIFGIYNKEIQDYLLDKIKETDNSVKSMYEARKIESKLAQKKIVWDCNTHSFVSEAIKRGFKYDHGNSNDDHRDFKSQKKCGYCGQSHRRGKRNCPTFGKTCDKCGGKNHFRTVCKSNDKESESKCDSRRSDRTKRKNVHDIECQNDMEDLMEQV